MIRKSLTGKYKLMSLNSLLPHEEVETNSLSTLEDKIKSDQIFTTPIIVDKKSRLIIDGHHRFHAIKRLGLSKILAFEVNYFNQKIIAKKDNENGTIISKKWLIRTAKTKLLPKKSTYHEVMNKKGEIEKLSDFVKGHKVPLKNLT